jgi:leucyl aminopeptidase
MIDFATLTGAARVALGTEVAVLFTNSDAVAAGLAEASGRTMDPLWRLPLHKPYRELLDSKIANIANCSSGPFAGAITAALFLEEFVPGSVEWAHFDVMAWNTRSQPGRPEGGEAMGIRAVFDYLKQRFGGR